MPCERTLVSELHLHLQSLEFFGDVGLGLRSHLLAGPLLDPVELLVDIHLADLQIQMRNWSCACDVFLCIVSELEKDRGLIDRVVGVLLLLLSGSSQKSFKPPNL